MLFVDCETRCREELKTVGVYRYTEHPSFEVLMVAWAADDGPVQVAVGKTAIKDIPWDRHGLLCAHNAGFDRVALSTLMPDLRDPERWYDSMVLAAMGGYPQGLEVLAQALGLEHQKNPSGKRLIQKFSKPRSDGTFRDAESDPDDWAQFVQYCCEDVPPMRAAVRTLSQMPLGADQMPLWRVDQRINDRGIRVDVATTRAAQAAAESNKAEAGARAKAITKLDNPNSPAQLKAWFAQTAPGLLPDLTAATVREALSSGGLSDEVCEVLRCRQAMSQSSTAKFTSVLNGVSGDARLRGMFRFMGAHTGRWAGRGAQLHNLPRAELVPGQSDHPELYQATLDTVLWDLEQGHGASAKHLKALIRPLLLGPMTVCDYNAIEARVLAWLASEEWILDVFRTGKKYYEETAARLASVTGRSYTRQDGKTASLALGYCGGVGAMRKMGAVGTDEVLLSIVKAWRKASPSIVQFWSRLEQAFISGGPVGRWVTVHADGKDRGIELPSGRVCWYRDCARSSTGRLSYAPGRAAGPRVDTYGGKLTENVTQAVARDVLGYALTCLDGAGYPIIGHVHDEILVEGEHQTAVEAVMNTPPDWAPGLPVFSKSELMLRYRK